MCIDMLESERIKKLNRVDDSSRDFIVYWMQQSQRTYYNHALEYAIEVANKKNKPLVVYFGITHKFPEANNRHYQFMLQGLKQVQENLSKKNIQLVISKQHPVKGIIDLSKEAAVVVVDRGYLRIQKEWRKSAADRIHCPCIQIESDVIVPVEIASDKEEYAAYTLRPKINRLLPRFLTSIAEHKLNNASLDFSFSSVDITDIESFLSKEDIDTSVSSISHFIGGENNAMKMFNHFLKHHIQEYDEKRNDPSQQVTSQMSPYLHFGNISPLFIALQVKNKRPQYADGFLEELIVRRELSMNFVHYSQQYDALSCLPQWAFDSLKKHEKDKRDQLYSKEELEHASTDDNYWNAAQNEMRYTGKMHGYMRMYWGKKIIEWTKTPAEAFEIALYLNNKYELDGRDPNGYAGVAWCFGKHDRAWKEREIFGKIRYMNKAGLRRKVNMKGYIEQVEKQMTKEK